MLNENWIGGKCYHYGGVAVKIPKREFKRLGIPLSFYWGASGPNFQYAVENVDAQNKTIVLRFKAHDKTTFDPAVGDDATHPSKQPRRPRDVLHKKTRRK